MMKKNTIAAVVAACLMALPVAAAEISLLLLSPDKAILLIDGKRRVLSVGQTSPEGVTLVETGEEHAVVETGGRNHRLGLKKTLAGGVPQASGTDERQREHRVYADPRGMFRTTGSINGLPTDFLVDTGATTIAMNAAQARRLGIDFRMDGKPVRVMTASGLERSYQVKLRSVKVGPIELTDVDATVMQGGFPAQVLLGMSFLGRLESERTPTMLLLRKAY